MSFMCDPCCEKIGVWGGFQSRGPCEVCRRVADCREISSSHIKAAKDKQNKIARQKGRSYIDDNGNYKPHVTQESLDAALVYVMGLQFCEAVKNRPTRHDAAIKEIFVKDLEHQQTLEEHHDADMKISIMIIRIAAQRLNDHGQYVWDEH